MPFLKDNATSVSCALQVNEALSDSPADMLDFSMKQELQQVHTALALQLARFSAVMLALHILCLPQMPAWTC